MKKETKKTIIKLIFILITLIFISLNILNINVFADSYEGIGPGQPGTENEQLNNTVKDVITAFQGVGGLIAIIMIIYLGIEYFRKSHNPEERAKLNDRIYSIILGVALVGGAVVILEFIKKTVTDNASEFI